MKNKLKCKLLLVNLKNHGYNIRKNSKGVFYMRTISIRLEDAIYEELSEMLDSMGQTKQTFYESFTRTALRERRIPFIIAAPVKEKTRQNNEKMQAFAKLEESRKTFSSEIDYEKDHHEQL